MSRLSTRLARLEGVRGAARSEFPVAVVRCPFPADEKEDWALGIIGRLGCPAAVWVLEGVEFETILPPTMTSDDAMPYGGDAERQWLDVGKHYPHFMILADARGGLLVERFDSETHERERTAELQSDLGVSNV